MKSFAKLSEFVKAWEDHFNWKRHVKRQREIKSDPDTFKTFPKARAAAKTLLSDFSKEPDDSVITIFQTTNENFKIDAISNYDGYELHSSEYGGEDVLAIVFFKEGKPHVKKMREFKNNS